MPTNTAVRNGKDHSKARFLDTKDYEHPLDSWLAQSLIPQDDWAVLPEALRADLRGITEKSPLLDRLVALHLLTRYQTDRIEAGTIHGLVLGNYRVLERIGAGGMGVVFLGEHFQLRRRVAIKVLPSLAQC